MFRISHSVCTLYSTTCTHSTAALRVLKVPHSVYTQRYTACKKYNNVRVCVVPLQLLLLGVEMLPVGLAPHVGLEVEGVALTVLRVGRFGRLTVVPGKKYIYKYRSM